MEKLKGLTTLPAVDERSPPEDEVDENGQTTDYEEHKSWCQKYIGQFMWLATRTRPDISATLGILASQMVIRPRYVHGCLKQLWRYIVGTRELDMNSLESDDVAFGELLLTLYVDASFSTGGGRSRTGIAMYLVNPIDEFGPVGIQTTDLHGYFCPTSRGISHGRGVCSKYILI